MKAILRAALAVAGVAIATQAFAQVTFYEREGFNGRSFTTEKQIGNFQRYGFNDRASSVVVTATGGRFAKTPGSAASASCCVRAGIRRWQQWV